MSYLQSALVGGRSAGTLALLQAMRVFIRPVVKLQTRPGQAAVLETKPPFQWIAGRTASSDPRHVESGRRSDGL
jgi:hypothetical protein